MRGTNVEGFSLLELIGVMAVMAILAGALAPSVFQLIEEGYQTAERQSLETIADALERRIVRTGSIPTEDVADWTSAVASYASIAPNRVRRNEKNFERRLFVDRKFFTDVNAVFPGYTQDQGLAVPPYSPRILLVSSLDGAVSTALGNHDQFSAVWEQTADAALEESKTLLIQRINLAPHFVRVVLSNANSSAVGFALEGGSEASVAGASGGADGTRSVYVLAETRMDLNAAPYPGGDTLRQLIVRRDVSLRYELDGSNWHWSD